MALAKLKGSWRQPKWRNDIAASKKKKKYRGMAKINVSNPGIVAGICGENNGNRWRRMKNVSWQQANA